MSQRYLQNVELKFIMSQHYLQNVEQISIMSHRYLQNVEQIFIMSQRYLQNVEQIFIMSMHSLFVGHDKSIMVRCHQVEEGVDFLLVVSCPVTARHIITVVVGKSRLGAVEGGGIGTQVL